MTLPSEGVTGRFSQYPYTATLDMAERLQPDAEQVAIIGGVSKFDSVAVSAAVVAVKARTRHLSIIMLQGLTYGALQKSLADLPPRTIALWTSLRQDQAGQRFVPGELIPEMSRVSAAPVYGSMHTGIGQGLVGGAVVLPAEEAIATSKLVMRVLRARRGAPLPPVAYAPTIPMADWRQLRRWRLDEDQLPPGTDVAFRAPGIWERYRVAILASLGLIALEAGLIALLLVERERRRRAQLAIEDQMAYEQTIADLTTDAVRHSPEQEIPALEDALARVSRYAGATRAVLVQYPDGPTRPPLSMTWSADGVGIATTSMLTRARGRVSGGGNELEIPLIADGVPIGALTLYRPSIRKEWSPRLVGRLGAAGELIAGAMARARSARAVRAGEELNRAVLASLSTEIAILDREGVIIRVNEAWRELGREAGVAEWRDAFIGENYLDECRRAEQDGCTEAGDVRRGIESVLERRAGPFRAGPRLHASRQAEVGHVRLTVCVDQDVGRLEVAVDDAALVRVVDGAGDGEQQPHRGPRVPGQAAHVRTQTRPLDQLHAEVRQPVLLARLVERDDVRVIQLRRRLGLGAEAAQLCGRGERPGQDHLEGDDPVEPDVPCPEHDPHAAAAEFLQQLVPLHVRQAVRDGHGSGPVRTQGFARCPERGRHIHARRGRARLVSQDSLERADHPVGHAVQPPGGRLAVRADFQVRADAVRLGLGQVAE